MSSEQDEGLSGALHERVCVIGAGTMGNGIAQVFAACGSEVSLVDLDADALVRGLATIEKNLARVVKKERITAEEAAAALARITTGDSLALAAECGLVVEAIVEKAAVKAAVFAELDGICRADAILASNTSSISITEIAASTQRPQAVIGMHFMNPVPVMKLVEVIRGKATSDETTARVVACSEAIGKVPVEVNDAPGFVSNRVLMPMINEAALCVMEGVATAEGVDAVMKIGMAHPMGPLVLADLIGLDVCVDILGVMRAGLDDVKYEPCALLREKVAAGHLGRKSGEGFYSYK
jgi:3-hydroxybutyryl-CoA dehydrogenase